MIINFLIQNALLYGQETALIERNAPGDDTPVSRRELTWREFDCLSNKVANFLCGEGIKRDTKVGMLMTNCLEWLPIYFGILKAGCVVVPINYRCRGQELSDCLDLADVEILFVSDTLYRDSFLTEKTTLPLRRVIVLGAPQGDSAYEFYSAIGRCPTEFSSVFVPEDSLAAIYFTSGTTGRPKAIMHTHRALEHSCVMEQKHHGQTHDDVFLLIPPLYHTGAKMHWFGSLCAGSAAVILLGVSPKRILDAVSQERCTLAWLLVPWAQDIMDALDSGRLSEKAYRLSQWRLTHFGAQPVPPALLRRWRERFPRHLLDINYGLSESLGPGCLHLGVTGLQKEGSVGCPGYGWQAKILNADNEEAAVGTAGELLVKGPGVMLGYYKNADATKEALQGGWLRTGDMAKRDGDGYYYLVDRKKDLIITGGENIFPVQIENFLRENSKIKDVAVIGLPDTRLGEIAAAIIELKEGESATVPEINDYCLGLPRYKRPRVIIFDRIPRNPTGKIQKTVLREKYH